METCHISCSNAHTVFIHKMYREEAEEDAEEDADEDAEEELRPGFVISKRTSDFEITHVKQTGICCCIFLFRIFVSYRTV